MQQTKSIKGLNLAKCSQNAILNNNLNNQNMMTGLGHSLAGRNYFNKKNYIGHNLN